MPAEWEPHEATWLGWPHEITAWPGKFAVIPSAFAESVRHLSRVERVFLLVENRAAESRVRTMLKKSEANLDAVDFFRIPTDRGWMRDTGPICVRNEAGEVAYNNFLLNGWAKYPNHKKDAAVVAKANQKLKRRVWQPQHKGRRVVLEGGSIDVNGRGTLLTTEECLLSSVQQRNPGVNRGQLENIFANYLGAHNVIWLGEGIAGDDTHGHVDDIARFVNATTVVAASERDPADVNHKPLRDNLRRLKKARDQNGRRLRVAELPMPSPVIFQGRRLPASYANFYICNSAVLVPTYNDPNDRVALNVLTELFPSRKIVPIYSGDFIWGFGATHCMTQQQPA